MCALTACHVFYYPLDHFKPSGLQDSINEERNSIDEKTKDNAAEVKCGLNHFKFGSSACNFYVAFFALTENRAPCFPAINFCQVFVSSGSTFYFRTVKTSGYSKR